MNRKKLKVESYVNDFLSRLVFLNEANIPFNGYPKDYLLYLLQFKAHYVALYQSIIRKITENTSSQIEDIVFVDYGTGNGLMAMFASMLPFYKVIAIDLDRDFLEAARQTAGLLSFEGIEFIHGGEQVLKLIETEEKTVVVAGTDVIEHIYDLDLFFRTLSHIPGLSVLVFTTASNPENPRIVSKLKALHVKEELVGGDSEDRVLFGDSHKSFFELRMNVITHFRPSMDKILVGKLSKLSRGLRKDDIERMILSYEQNREIPIEIGHPTNTCHPETGSWSERLVELHEYENLYTVNGFRMIISNGFYDSRKGNLLRRLIIRVINWMIRVMPVNGRKIAPFIVLTGVKKS